MSEFSCAIDILQIRCIQCKLLCGVGPVSNESDNFFCGRCRPGAAPSLLFEEVAKKSLFPCRFECEDLVPWGQVLNHEKFCRERTVICPFANCTSTAKLESLFGHIKEAHPLFYQDSRKVNQVELGSTDKVLRLHCIKYGKFTFLFFMKFSRDPINKSLCYVSYKTYLVCPQNSEQTEAEALQWSLEIQIPCTDTKLTQLIHGRQIEMYYDRQHCLNCLYGNCKKTLHENKCDWISADLSITVVSSEKRIFYSIDVHKIQNAVIIVPQSLECPVCLEYMTDKIYLCEQGHSVCAKCKQPMVNQTFASNQKKVCPTCRSDLRDSRNYKLEALIESMKIPCRKNTSGCTFAGLVKDVKIHENECSFPP